MMLRYRKYLREAAYWRDKEVRKTAEQFYEKLVKFLRHRSDELEHDPKQGIYAVRAGHFWKDPRARNLAVIFTPTHSGTKGFRAVGGIGTAGNVRVITFPVLIGPSDKRHLDTRLDKNTVIHEVIHLLDPGTFVKGRAGFGGAKKKALGSSDYYNDPGEWNAYWQQGAAQLERLIRSKAMSHPKAREHFLGSGTLADLQGRAGRFWDANYLQSLNKKNRRKFDKRLAQLWSALKDKDLL